MKKAVLGFCCLLIISISFCGCGYLDRTFGSENSSWLYDLIVDDEFSEFIINVYLEDVSLSEAVDIGKEIEKIPNVSQVEFVSKEEALEEYKDVLSEEQYEDNPLPHSYKVVLTDTSLYELTMDAIQEVDGVDSVR